jgi:DNA-binding NarL/FixJ family response regulator
VIRILITDDHAIVRQGLKQILSAMPDLTVAGEAADGHEALARIRSENFDVALLDVSMPGMSGIELIKRIKAERPRLPILVLSMHKEQQFALRALKAGAAGYLTKESAPELLVSAIRKIAGGGRFITPELAEHLAASVDPFSQRTASDALSDREFQVLRMIVAGRALSDIAAELSLSIKTVSTHKTRIMKKLGVETNVELLQYALRHGLSDAP